MTYWEKPYLEGYLKDIKKKKGGISVISANVGEQKVISTDQNQRTKKSKG